MQHWSPKVRSVLFVSLAFCLVVSSIARADRLRAYAETDYKGSDAMFRDPAPNLTTRNPPLKIASVRVLNGRWFICAGVDFSGDCVWLSRDIPSFPDLGFTDRPGSLRPENVPILERHWGDRRPAARNALALFERPSYDGEWTALSESVQDFDAAHLKSPGSIVLGEGVWRLCTGPGYTGRCLILTGSVWNLPELFPGQFHSAQRHAPGATGWTAITSATTPPPAQPPASLKCRTHRVPTQVKDRAGKLVWRCTKEL
jgi:hypothetical protein